MLAPPATGLAKCREADEVGAARFSLEQFRRVGQLAHAGALLLQPGAAWCLNREMRSSTQRVSTNRAGFLTTQGE